MRRTGNKNCLSHRYTENEMWHTLYNLDFDTRAMYQEHFSALNYVDVYREQRRNYNDSVRMQSPG